VHSKYWIHFKDLTQVTPKIFTLLNIYILVRHSLTTILFNEGLCFLMKVYGERDKGKYFNDRSFEE
jgi:hypothetical protein